MADKATKELERIYTIPLREVKSSPRNHRADRAVRAVRAYLTRHMKANDVWLDTSVNELLWERGMYRIPSKIRVRALKFDDGVVEVTLPEADVTSSIREKMAKEREAQTEEKEKGEKKEKKGKGEEKEEPKEEAEPTDEEGKATPEKPAPKKEAAKKASAPTKRPAAAKTEHKEPKKPADKE